MGSKQGLKRFRARVAEYFYEDVPLSHTKGRQGKGEGKAAKGPGAPDLPAGAADKYLEF